MILRTPHGDREVRSVTGEWGSSAIPPPGSGGIFGQTTYAGARVNVATAGGLPAVAACIRLIAETAASLPAVINEGRGPTGKAAQSAWQTELVVDNPNDEQDVFSFWYDVFTGPESWGNTFIEKLKGTTTRTRGRVLALTPLDPSSVTVLRDAQDRKVFRVMRDGRSQDLDAGRILHVRGFTFGSGLEGLSPIGVHRQMLGTTMAQYAHLGRFYANAATPFGVVTVPGALKEQGAKEIADAFQRAYSNQNAHRPAILHNGATYAPTTVSPRDAQFVEAMKFSAEEIARLYRVPATLIGAVPERTIISAEEESLRFLQFALLPRLRRIEASFRKDADLLGPGSNLFLRFNLDEIQRASMVERFQAYISARQAGVFTANEIREKEGYGPVPGGDELQLVPVGGAENPAQKKPDAKPKQTGLEPDS